MRAGSRPGRARSGGPRRLSLRVVGPVTDNLDLLNFVGNGFAQSHNLRPLVVLLPVCCCSSHDGRIRAALGAQPWMTGLLAATLTDRVAVLTGRPFDPLQGASVVDLCGRPLVWLSGVCAAISYGLGDKVLGVGVV